MTKLQEQSKTKRAGRCFVAGLAIIAAAENPLVDTGRAIAVPARMSVSPPRVDYVNNTSRATMKRIREIERADKQAQFVTTFLLYSPLENTSRGGYRTFVQDFISSSDNAKFGPLQVVVDINPLHTLNYPAVIRKNRDLNSRYALNTLSNMVDYATGPDAGGPPNPLDNVFIADGGMPETVSAQNNARALLAAGFDATPNQEAEDVTGLAYNNVATDQQKEVYRYVIRTTTAFVKLDHTLIAPQVAEY